MKWRDEWPDFDEEETEDDEREGVIDAGYGDDEEGDEEGDEGNHERE